MSSSTVPLSSSFDARPPDGPEELHPLSSSEMLSVVSRLEALAVAQQQQQQGDSDAEVEADVNDDECEVPSAAAPSPLLPSRLLDLVSSGMANLAKMLLSDDDDGGGEDGAPPPPTASRLVLLWHEVSDNLTVREWLVGVEKAETAARLSGGTFTPASLIRDSLEKLFEESVEDESLGAVFEALCDQCQRSIFDSRDSALGAVF